MDGNRSRMRRIARRTALYLGVPVLLLLAYIATWLTASRACGDGLLHWKTGERLRPAFAPILVYAQSESTGADSLRRLWWWANPMISRNDYGTIFSPTAAITLAPVDRTGVALPPGMMRSPPVNAVGPMAAERLPPPAR